MILAIDTATSTVGLALHDGATVLSEHSWLSREHHTVELAPEVALAFRRIGIEAKDLTGVAVARGPGSYTGLRIGMALAKGIAMAHGLPLIGVPTLDILAAARPEQPEPMLCVLQAGRGRIASVWYKWERDAWQAQSSPENLTWKAALARLEEPTYVCGELRPDQREKLRRERWVMLASPAQCVRRPGVLAELAQRKLLAGESGDPKALSPIYLGSLDGAPA